jgi:iron complex transport system ATP-binding protein
VIGRDSPPGSRIALSCEALAFGYGSRIVLQNLTLEFPARQWTAIVGPNGCGKSTLLRTLAGLSAPMSGSIGLLGKSLFAWTRRERARRLAWLAQGGSPTELSGAEVVGLGRFAHAGWLGTRQVEDEAAVQRAMAATGCLEWAQRRLTSLSGGERQRIYLARALAVEAQVLLLDEPTTHLDPPHQEDVVRLLRAEAHERGASVVSAIHDLSLALAADRVVVIGPLGLVGQGTVSDALRGDWLSTAFGTPIDIIDSNGTPLWRPVLEAVQRD